jgi:hypothetical protein
MGLDLCLGLSLFLTHAQNHLKAGMHEFQDAAESSHDNSESQPGVNRFEPTLGLRPASVDWEDAGLEASEETLESHLPARDPIQEHLGKPTSEHTPEVRRDDPLVPSQSSHDRDEAKGEDQHEEGLLRPIYKISIPVSPIMSL